MIIIIMIKITMMIIIMIKVMIRSPLITLSLTCTSDTNNTIYTSTYLTKVTNDICVKYFWARVFFSKSNTA